MKDSLGPRGQALSVESPFRALLRRARAFVRPAIHQTRRIVSDIHAMRLGTVPSKPGVLFVGYAEGEFGLGQSFRNMVVAAATTELSYAIHPFNFHLEGRQGPPFMPQCYARAERRDTTVLEFSADQIDDVLSRLDPRLLHDSRKILRTYWELPTAPAAWRNSLRRFDELWVPNEFVANALRSVFSGPVIIIRPCVDVGAIDRDTARRNFGLDDNKFNFLFTFDYASFPARKNPLGLVTAFRDAFPADRKDVRLIIKSNGNPTSWPDVAARLNSAAHEDPRIRLVAAQLPRKSILELIRASDCYVSLHRSEGFGQGMAEAMALGVPVIGTDFSGSMDFLNERTGFPVSFSLRAVARHEYPWSEGQSWAEPNLVHAARIMRRVVVDAAERGARADAAKALITTQYSPFATGSAIASRIERLSGGVP